MACGGVPCVHVVAVIWGSLEIVLFAGVIFGWHSVVYIYKDSGYFAHLCPSGNESLLNTTLTLQEQVTTASAALYNTSYQDASDVGLTDAGLSDGDSSDADLSCLDKLAALKKKGKEVCFSQDMHFNLIFSLATSVTGLCCVAMGFLYDRFGTRFLRSIAVVLYITGLLCLVFSSSSLPFQLYPGFLLTTLGGYGILLTNLQLAGLIPRFRSTLMSLYSGSYDCSAAIFLIFKISYEAGLLINYSFAIQMALFCMVLISTFLVLPYRRLPWPLPPHYRLNPPVLRKCQKQDNKDPPTEVTMTWTSQEWNIDDNGSIVLATSPHYSSQDTLDNVDVVYEINDKDIAEMVAKDLLSPEKGETTEEKMNGLTVPVTPLESVPFSKVVLSPLFLWDLWWMCTQRLRSWFFVGIFNPWITQLTCGDHQKISHYTSVYASMQFFGILTAPLSGRLMDRRTAMADIFHNPRFARLHASIASFLLNCTVSVVLSILVSIPVLQLQYISFFLHTIHRSFLYGPNSAFVANAFPTEHFGKLFGITLTVSAIFGSLQYPLFLIIQGPLNNNPLAVNIFFIILMVSSFAHPIYIRHYVKNKLQKQKQKEAEEEATH